MSTGRKPDYNLGALDKTTDMKGKIGAAWVNPNGTVSIRLNPWVVLDGSNPELVLTLFPYEEWNGDSKSKKRNHPTSTKQQATEFYDANPMENEVIPDDIPY